MLDLSGVHGVDRELEFNTSLPWVRMRRGAAVSDSGKGMNRARGPPVIESMEGTERSYSLAAYRFRGRWAAVCWFPFSFLKTKPQLEK